MKKKYFLLGTLLPLFFSCSNDSTPTTNALEKMQITVKNPLDSSREDVLLYLDADQLKQKHTKLANAGYKFTAGEDLPFQFNDLNGDGKTDQVALLVDLKPNEEKQITISPLGEGEELPQFDKRTQAEISHKINGSWKEREYQGGEFKNVNYLRVPPEHTDHSWFIRYEGPGWESDMVGYRFYLDWRNATDIFGKKTTDMVLQDVGQDGFDSYHEPAAWGMDVLKVGKSLGIGALGTWQGDRALRVEETDSLSCEIVLNGPVESKVRTMYHGWKVGDKVTDVTSVLSIHAGSRLTRHDVTLSQSLSNLCSGIVKHENGKLLSYENGDWAYIATWGKQSLADDHLGMAILYRKNDAVEITEDEHSHVVVLKPKNNQLTYYFLASWEQEPNAIQTQEAFVNYLKQTVAELGMPPAISL